jgi:sucrose phosphorylase
MNEAIQEHLEAIYGPASANLLSLRIEALMDAWRPKLPALKEKRASLKVSQRDAILITYADQLRLHGISPLHSLAEFCDQYLANTIGAIHLLPFYPWSSDDGFSVKDFFAVSPDYGSWDDIARMSRTFDLMFDAVFNHASAQGEWFQRYLADDPLYREFFVCPEEGADLSQVVRPRALPLLTAFKAAKGPVKIWTTFSSDQVDLNVKNPEVLIRLLEALLFYVSKGARFIRLDAIAFLWKEPSTTCLHLPQTHWIIQLFRAVLDDLAPQVCLITETNVPHLDNISYFGDGENEAQLVYNFALPPLVLHSFSTGNAERLTSWAQTLKLPSDQVTFFNFLASHDGIGLNPARGILDDGEIEALVNRTLAHGGFISYKDTPTGQRVPYEMNINYLDALSNPAANEAPILAARKLLSSHSILLSLQGVPGIYFHSLFGSRGDRASAVTSGIPRRINRQKLDRKRLDEELKEADSLRHLVYAGQRELLDTRQAHLAFSPSSGQRIIQVAPAIFALLRGTSDQSERILCVHNVSAESVEVCPTEALPEVRRWLPLWTNAEVRFNGEHITLEPFASAWLLANP